MPGEESFENAAPVENTARKSNQGRQTAALTIVDKLPELALARKVDLSAWNALRELYDCPRDESLALVLDYCRARKMDPLKKPVHIVPIWSHRRQMMVDTIWPSIAEVRMTAMRTKLFAGRDATTFGPTVTQKIGGAEVTFPEWAQVTVYRLVNVGAEQERHAFPGAVVRWRETYSTQRRDDPTPNAMWRKRPFGQLEKCAEAAALRAAFPEELGNEYIPEEMTGRQLEDGAVDIEASETNERPALPEPKKGGAKAAAASESPAQAAGDNTAQAAAGKQAAAPATGSQEATAKPAQNTPDAPKTAENQSPATSTRRTRRSPAGGQATPAQPPAQQPAASETPAAAGPAAPGPESCPEIAPGVTLIGFHGKAWPQLLQFTLKEVTPKIAAGTTPYLDLVVKAQGYEGKAASFEGVAVGQDGQATITNPLLKPGAELEANFRAKVRGRPEAPVYNRPPALMLTDIVEATPDI
jgi:phage recombination protein Bet